MAVQSPWRMAGEHRRRVQIAAKFDPIIRDPATPPDAAERRRAFIGRNLGAMEMIDRPAANLGERVLEQAQAASDDHEVNQHGGGSTFAK